MTGLISVDEALTRLAANGLDIGATGRALEAAYGCRLSQPLLSRVMRPPAAVSAMDGYAVRLVDVAKAGSRLKVIGEAPAGAPFSGRVSQGEAVRIFTGAVLPEGADHIVIQEDVMREGGVVVTSAAYTRAEFVRAEGIDFRTGEVLLPAATRLGAAELSIAAAANHGTVTVRRRPRVGILANGDELRAPGSDLAAGEIVNSNPVGLGALVREWGGEPIDLGVVADSEAAIAAHIRAAVDIDMFLPVGGASVGDHDHMRAAFAAEGFAPVFEKVAVRPGKPTWFSVRGGQRVLGLPGNPASAFVCAHLFLRPLLEGVAAAPDCPARTAEPIAANGPRESYLRAHVSVSESGILEVLAARNQDSSLMKPFLHANALVRRLPHAEAVAAGDVVTVRMIGPLLGDPAL